MKKMVKKTKKRSLSTIFLLLVIAGTVVPNIGYGQLTRKVTITASDGTTNTGEVTIKRIPGGPPAQASMVIKDGFGRVWEFTVSQVAPGAGAYGDPENGPYFKFVGLNIFIGKFPDCCGIATFK